MTWFGDDRQYEIPQSLKGFGKTAERVRNIFITYWF